MKKLLTVLLAISVLLVLAGCCSHEWYAASCEAPKTCAKCGETEGEALGHSWADATCTAPKTCSVCHAQEGSALGHNWIDATTEAPKTCIACNLTEGERIITDPRFTTAATKDLHGKWVLNHAIPLENIGFTGLDLLLELQVTLVLDNEGTLNVNFTALNGDAINAAMCEILENSLYEEYAAQGLTKEVFEALVVDQYGMTLSEFVADYVNENGVPAALSNMAVYGVYYVEGNQIFTGGDWDTELVKSEFTLEGDTLSFVDSFVGIVDPPEVFQRSAE